MLKASRAFRLQSAMEYLMTYGWAILIIAVVLGALFQLGVFDPSTFSPKAHAGSCQVIRPYGPGNVNYISLAGTCNNQLPQYVMLTSGASGMAIPYAPRFYPSQATIVFWLSTTTHGLSGWRNLVSDAAPYQNCDTSGSYCIRLCCSELYLSAFNGAGTNYYTYVPESSIDNGVWHMIVGTVSNSYITLYVDSKQEGTPTAFSGPPRQETNQERIGDLYAGYNGLFANVQIYNTSLSQNDITALYNEGIGGAPIDLFHLVGWWPLNGNANDYSGNVNDGTATSITYSGSWATSYSQP